MNPQDYSLLLSQYEPTAEDQAAAKKQAFMRAGLGILAANKPGIGNNLAGILAQGGLQGLDGYQADLKQSSLRGGARQLAQRNSADSALLAQALQGRPAQPAGLVEDASGNVTQADALPAQSPVQALGRAIPMMGGGMQPVALNALIGAQTREDQQAHQTREREDARAFRAHESAMAAQRASEQAVAQRTFLEQQARQAAADREALKRMEIDARPKAAPRAPQIIQGAEGPMVLGDDGVTARPVIGPDGKPVKPSQGRVGPMTATAQKELIETEEGIQGGQAALGLFKQAKDLNNKAMGFSGAGAVASAGSLLPSFLRPEAIDATSSLDNILQTAALPQLKAIFGGMPTEGERKILLDVQGSSSKSPAVRKEIFERAEKAIQARIKFGAEKVKRLRDGTYFSGEGLPSIQVEDAPGAAPLSPQEEQELAQLRARFGRR